MQILQNIYVICSISFPGIRVLVFLELCIVHSILLKNIALYSLKVTYPHEYLLYPMPTLGKKSKKESKFIFLRRGVVKSGHLSLILQFEVYF